METSQMYESLAESLFKNIDAIRKEAIDNINKAFDRGCSLKDDYNPSNAYAGVPTAIWDGVLFKFEKDENGIAYLVYVDGGDIQEGEELGLEYNDGEIPVNCMDTDLLLYTLSMLK